MNSRRCIVTSIKPESLPQLSLTFKPRCAGSGDSAAISPAKATAPRAPKPSGAGSSVFKISPTPGSSSHRPLLFLPLVGNLEDTTPLSMASLGSPQRERTGRPRSRRPKRSRGSALQTCGRAVRHALLPPQKAQKPQNTASASALFEPFVAIAAVICRRGSCRGRKGCPGFRSPRIRRGSAGEGRKRLSPADSPRRKWPGKTARCCRAWLR